ncbi:MAG TPA: hypothetical protein PKC28_04165 [Bdellovibrionales bacterium]|nr:hypothetical protein [Bdellovibrionales bacterium]
MLLRTLILTLLVLASPLAMALTEIHSCDLSEFVVDGKIEFTEPTSVYCEDNALVIPANIEITANGLNLTSIGAIEIGESSTIFANEQPVFMTAIGHVSGELNIVDAALTELEVGALTPDFQQSVVGMNAEVAVYVANAAWTLEGNDHRITR